MEAKGQHDSDEFVVVDLCEWFLGGALNSEEEKGIGSLWYIYWWKLELKLENLENHILGR